MKYTIEMSEGEYRQGLTTLESIVKTLCETAITMEKLRIEGFRHERTVVNSGADASDSDGVPDTAHAPDTKVLHFEPVERPHGGEVGRGDDRGLSGRVEEPLPARAVVTDALLAKGRKAFQSLINLWCMGFGDTEAEQPDRAEAMRALANGRKSYAVLTYVKDVGGLTHAVNDALADWEGEESRRREVVTLIAGNVTQVASILFPDLSELYEHKNIFRSEDTDDE